MWVDNERPLAVLKSPGALDSADAAPHPRSAVSPKLALSGPRHRCECIGPVPPQNGASPWWTCPARASAPASRARPTVRRVPALSCLPLLEAGSHLSSMGSERLQEAAFYLYRCGRNIIEAWRAKVKALWIYLPHSCRKRSSIAAFASSLPILPTQRLNLPYKTGELACWIAGARV